eukprot:4864029-Prymnesium_polylepis.1
MLPGKHLESTLGTCQSHRPLGDRPRASREPGRAARPRPAARDVSYHYYVIDNLVDEDRRQGG